MRYVSFDHLLALTQGGSQVVGNGFRAFSVAESNPSFVEPSLGEVEPGTQPRVVLLAARGAAGKTFLARELSARAGAPLWSLQDDKAVSGDALTARLTAFLGSPDPLAASGQLPCLVIDSMDEARLRVTGQSWDEFLEALAEYAGAGLRLIILGRKRTIEDVWVEFAELGINSALYEISHFGDGQQVRYVDLKALEGQAPSPAYVAARDAVLKSLRESGDLSLGDAFVGYPPVLDAVATLVKRGTNHAVVANDFYPSTARGRRIDVLELILFALLKRDQSKAAPLARDLGLDPNTTYTVDEQLDWLAHELLGASAPRLEAYPADVRIEYLEQIAGFRADHPFVSNREWASPVFASFVASRRLQTADEAALVAIGRASGLLFEFLAIREGHCVLELTEGQLVCLQASLMAGEWLGTDSTVEVRAQNGPEILSVDAQLSVVEGSDGARRSVFAQVLLDSPSVLALVGPLVSTDVVFPGRLIISSGEAPSLDLGPDVYLRANDVELRGASLQVCRANDRSEGTGVEIEATNKFEATLALLGKVPKSDFSITVPTNVKLVYPWTDYRVQHDDADTSAIDGRARRFLDKLMNLARKHGHDGERAVYVKKLEGRQNLRSEDFSSVLALLQEEGVVYRVDDLVFIHAKWDLHRYDGKGRLGMPAYEEKRHVWDPILEKMSRVIRSA